MELMNVFVNDDVQLGINASHLFKNKRTVFLKQV